MAHEDAKRDGASDSPDVDAAGAWVKGDDLNARMARLRGSGKAEPRTPGYTLTQAPATAPPAQMEGGDAGVDEGRIGARDGAPEDGPCDIDNSLAPPEVEKVAGLKEEGNAHFKAGEYAQARDAYAKGAEVYDGRKGADASQRAERVKLLSNLSEACLKLGEWQAALRWVESALEVEPQNTKARLRRARALGQIGGLTDLDLAINILDELSREAGGRLGTTERQLYAQLLDSRRTLRSAAAENARELRAAFASGSGLGGRDASANGASAPAAPLYVTEESVVSDGLQGLGPGQAAELWESARDAGHDHPAAVANDEPVGISDAVPAAAPIDAELMAAIEQVSHEGATKAVITFEKAEWLCRGVVRGESKFGRFRANATMRSALLDVPGGEALVRALGYHNVGRVEGAPNEDEWWEAGCESAELVLRCERALALFGRMKSLLNGRDGAKGAGEAADKPDGPPSLPPVSASNGGEAAWGSWSQTREEVHARVSMARGMRASDLRVDIRRRSVRVAALESILLDGELGAEVDADECSWQLGDDGVSLEISLTKLLPATKAGRFGPAGWWARVLVADPEYDVAYCDASEAYVKVDPRVAGMAAPHA